MKPAYVAAVATFFVGLAVGAVLIWFILPANVTVQNSAEQPSGPRGSATPSHADVVAEIDKCQPLLDDCHAYHDCVQREAGAAVANGLPDCPQAPAPPASAIESGDVILCFSPPVPADGCDPAAAVVHAIDSTKRTIWLQTYVLSSQAVVDSLLKAHDRHVAMTLIVDKQMLQEQPQLVLSLAQTGIAIRVDASVRGAARSSVMIVDGIFVLAGSFDFTNAAERWNADDLLVTSAHALVDRYVANWNFHLAHSEPVELVAAPSATAAVRPTPGPRRPKKKSKPAIRRGAMTKSTPVP
ncbi:MAG TPA: phospholipase D-like domain-containing protein [Candidatus Binataceae bacterium]|nr:phospholipase D-like domain-containing protein [Candidatus Binataceae bacterium]